MSRSVLLDSLSLDEELSSNIYSELQDATKYFPFDTFISRVLNLYLPEVKILTKGILIYLALWKNSASVSQQAVGIKIQNLTEGKLLAYIAFKTLPGFLKERSDTYLSYLICDGTSNDRVRKCLSYLQNILSFCQIINFLVFLQQGKHPDLASKVLQLDFKLWRTGFFDTNDEFLKRETLWSSFSEILMTIIPIMEALRLKDIILQNIKKWRKPNDICKGSNLVVPHSLRIDSKCPCCHDDIFIPAIAAPSQDCSHIFCYSCLSSNLKTTLNSFKCPICRTVLLPSNLKILKLPKRQ